MRKPGGALALLVEDDAGMRFALERALVPSGVRVVAVETVRAARSRLREARFDLVITDIDLPGGENGGAVVEAAAAEALPVLVVSASPPCVLTEAQRRLVSHWLRKPCPLAELRESVRALLEDERPPAASPPSTEAA